MPTKFICDAMLGKLCKLLRMCGIDTKYSNQGIALILEAKKEERIILTANTRLRGKEDVLFIKASRPLTQLNDVIHHYKLQNKLQLLTRCLDCNARLKSVSKESVKDKIPYYTYLNFDEFAQCPNCQKVFWKGSHYKNMVRGIEKILNSIKESK